MRTWQLLATMGHSALMGAAIGGHEAVGKAVDGPSCRRSSCSKQWCHRTDPCCWTWPRGSGKAAVGPSCRRGSCSKQWLPLHLYLAAEGGHEAVAKLLLDHRADVAAAQDYGATALMVAALLGHEAVAKLLLDHRADVAAASKQWCHCHFILLLKVAMRQWQSCCLDHRADVAAAQDNGAHCTDGCCSAWP